MKHLDRFLKNSLPGNAESVSLESMLFCGLVVSNEGLVDEMKDIFRNWKHGKKPTHMDLMDLRNNLDTIKKTYANPDWLVKRRFVEGEVSISVGHADLTGDYKQRVKAIQQKIKAVDDKNTAVIKTALRPVIPIVQALSRPKWWQASGAVSRFLHEVPSEFEGKFAALPHDEFPDHGVQNLPRLTQEQVLEAANYLIELMTYEREDRPKLKEFDKVFWDGEEEDLRYGDESQAYAILEEQGAGEEAKELLTQLHDYAQDIQENYYQSIGAEGFIISDYLHGIVRWIDASVK